jgi:hypothetical protein
MRSFVISAFALAVVLAPAATFAQATTTGQQPPAGQPPTAGQQPPAGQPPTAGQQPPAGQPPAGQQPPAGAQPAAPSAPKLTFTTPGGLLLVQVKPDQTAAFEEMFAKLKANLAKSQTPELSGMANSWHIYKTAEGMQGNALYVVLVDPAVPGTEYSFLDVLNKTMTPDEQRAPETQEMYKRFAATIAGLNKLNITPVLK